MSNPDAIVARAGTSMTLTRVLAALQDDYGDYDPDLSVTESVSFNAVPSLPTSRDQRALEGRGITASLRLTVPSSLDISSSRGTRRDQVAHDGVLYEVVDVRDDRNVFTGTRKKTVFLEHLPGR